jgi:hypothetical protein
MALRKDGGGRGPYTLGDIELLPPSLPPVESFRLLGIGKTCGYELIRAGVLPSLRLGGRILVPTEPLLRLLGVELRHERTLQPKSWHIVAAPASPHASASEEPSEPKPAIREMAE